MVDVSTELAGFFEAGEVSPEGIERVADLAHATFAARERFGELLSEYQRRVEQGQGEALKLAVGRLILGQFDAAREWFGKTPDGRLRRYYAAKAALGQHRPDEALAELRQAAQKGWDEFDTDMQAAAIHLQKGNLPAARQLLDKHARAGQDRAEWYFANALMLEHQDEREAAVDNYEKALTLDPDHERAMFRCARLYDIQGNDEQAIELYQRLSLQPRAYVNALINLSVIYEDLGLYDDALECLQRVLKGYPNHARARLFYKDVLSCRQMVVPEAGDEEIEPRNRLLDAAISDFELSVRARNCLKRMNIRTVGDLLRLNETELTSYKNFGESSLAEIKALLAKRGLRLGQAAEETPAAGGAAAAPVAAPPPPAVTVPPGREALLSKPVTELELSVRARRCLQRLNVVTLGELVQLTEADLLATRNFGVTSLNEVKGRLAEFGLSLAPKRPE
jgi:DNA-directed RNA polymerase subunit alpha